MQQVATALTERQTQCAGDAYRDDGRACEASCRTQCRRADDEGRTSSSQNHAHGSQASRTTRERQGVSVCLECAHTGSPARINPTATTESTGTYRNV